MREDGAATTLPRPSSSSCCAPPASGQAAWLSEVPRKGSLRCGPLVRNALSSCSLPQLPKADSLDCPRLPGLAWGRLVGCGSYGRVYKGKWQSERVAIKVLSPEGSKTRDFEALSECLVSTRVHHPNVVKTHTVLTVGRAAKQPATAEIASRCALGGCAAASKAASPAAEADAELDSMFSFFQAHKLDSVPEPSTAAAVPHAATSSGAEAAARALEAAAAEKFDAPMSPAAEGAWGRWTASCELHAILGNYSAFAADYAVSEPLAPSPFDTAVQQALFGSCDGSSGARVAAQITRSFSADADVAPTAFPPAADVAQRGSEHAVEQSTKSFESSSTDAHSSGCWLEGSWPAAGGAPPAAALPPHPPGWDDADDSAADRRTILIMEYADQSSLHKAVSRGRLQGDLEAILMCARDVAAGMSYLHSMGIVHADLKPANVLLKTAHASADDPRGFTCKIADFGMAQMLSAEDSDISTDTLGSLPYLAPEVLQLNKVTKASDVYSFAVLLLELWSGGVAFQDQNYHQVLYAVFSGYRPPVPADMPAGYRALVEDCWAADAKLRPSFHAVLARLTTLLHSARAGN